LLPLAVRTQAKIETIVRSEMTRVAHGAVGRCLRVGVGQRGLPLRGVEVRWRGEATTQMVSLEQLRGLGAALREQLA
jgi:hypothetical protein